MVNAREMLELISQSIATDTEFIGRHPDALFQCLWNRGWWYDSPGAADFYAPPEEGWPPAGPPWSRPGPKFHRLVMEWAKHLAGTRPQHHWLRAVLPPPPAIGSSLEVVIRTSGDVTRVAFTPDGEHVVATVGTLVQVWEAAGGFPLMDLKGYATRYDYRGQKHREPIEPLTALDVSADGSRIAAGSRDGTICIWEWLSPEPLVVIEGSHERIEALAFAPDGKQLAAGYQGYSEKSGRGFGEAPLYLYDAERGVVRRRLDGHQMAVTAVSFSPDGRSVISGSTDTTVRLWNTQTGDERRCLRWSNGQGARFVAVAADGTFFVSDSSGWDPGHKRQGEWVRVWDADSGAVRSEHALEGALLCMSRGDHPRIAVGQEKKLFLWDLLGSAVDSEIGAHESDVLCAAFSPNNDRIVTGSRDGSIRILRLDQGTTDPLPRVRGQHYRDAGEIEFSTDGSRLVSTSCVYTQTSHPLNEPTGVLVIRDATSGEVVKSVWSSERSIVTTMAFSSDGARLVTGHYNGSVAVWDLHSGEIVASCLDDSVPPPVRTIVSSEGAHQVVFACGGTLWAWETRCREPNRMVAVKDSQIELAVSRDGSKIAARLPDGTVRVWGSSPLVELCAPPIQFPQSLAFAPDGSLLAVSDGVFVGICRTATGELLRKWRPGARRVAFTRDGQSLVCETGGSIDVRDVQTGDRREIQGVCDFDAIVRGSPPSPYTVYVNGGETRVTFGRDAPAVAAFPAGLTRSHPSLPVWAGFGAHGHLWLVRLERTGDSDALATLEAVSRSTPAPVPVEEPAKRTADSGPTAPDEPAHPPSQCASPERASLQWLVEKLEGESWDFRVTCPRCGYTEEFNPRSGDRGPGRCPRCSFEPL